MQNKQINRNIKIRQATRKMILATVQKQTQEAQQKQGGEAISSISVQSETMCETNTQCRNAEKQEKIWLLTKEISDKEKKIERMAGREKEMQKRDSE